MIKVLLKNISISFLKVMGFFVNDLHFILYSQAIIMSGDSIINFINYLRNKRQKAELLGQWTYHVRQVNQ